METIHAIIYDHPTGLGTPCFYCGSILSTAPALTPHRVNFPPDTWCCPLCARLQGADLTLLEVVLHCRRIVARHDADYRAWAQGGDAG
jgi:hypothetical protein